MSKLMFPKLFEPGKVGKLELKNRIIKAPMGTFLAREGVVTPKHIRHYEEQARGGAALIIVEPARVWPSKLGFGIPGYDDSHIAGLASLAKVVHENGAKASLQIARGSGKPEVLSIEEVKDIPRLYAEGARRAKAAGYDTVEVHGAHGNLTASFLSPRFNRRTDEYGGSNQNRMRLMIEIVRAIRAKVGPDFPITVRFSASEYIEGGTTIADSIEVVKALEQEGLDLIHVSGGRMFPGGWYTNSPMPIQIGTHVWAAEAIKKAVKIPVIASGAITTPQFAEEILESGKADYISLGRPLFADPYWPQKALAGKPEDIVPCIRCLDGCQYRSSDKDAPVICTVNPDLGREGQFPVGKAEKVKNVAVVGAGPAGLEAARVLALRGHKVTLFEKKKLGGKLIEVSVPDFMSDLRILIDYYANQMKELKIKIIHKEAVTDDLKKGFDAVIIAVGGVSIKPDVFGINRTTVVDVIDVLDKKVKVGDKVLVVGGGVEGSQIGLWLAEQGKKVTFIEPEKDFMADVWPFDKALYQERFDKLKVTVNTNTRLVSVLDDGAKVVDKEGIESDLQVDTIVLALGMEPQMALKEQLKNIPGLEVFAAGDCVHPRKIFEAIHAGFVIARKI